MSKTNALSALGRMSWSIHLLFYPGALLFGVGVVKPYMDNNAKKAEQEEWDNMPKARKLDPDLFNPFTCVPYHNNPELKYVYANNRLFNYVNENHINVKDYPWKNYHNSYDHDNQSTYLYNWTSLHSKIDDNKGGHH